MRSSILPKEQISPPSAPADLSRRAHLQAVRRRLPRDAASYASPSQRTVDTARAFELDPILVPEFGDFGHWTGRRHDDLAALGDEGYAEFWKDPARSSPLGGESFEDQIARVRDFVE
ncbi:histidine phosphatase family protein [Bradyrhizobium paxllaeri]|uniref:histidine phosphatase family protein n=1 Tax=Bradyrhizobium paxllaeri TaxID=190148 RepID=UPI003D3161B0